MLRDGGAAASTTLLRLEAVGDLQPANDQAARYDWTVHKPYPSDVSDNERALVAPYLTWMPEHCGQREHVLREVFTGWRPVIKTGAPWLGCRTTCALGRRVSRRFREALITRGIIPSTHRRKIPIPGDKGPYRPRHRVETMFNRLKDWRRAALRYAAAPIPSFQPFARRLPDFSGQGVLSLSFTELSAEMICRGELVANSMR